MEDAFKTMLPMLAFMLTPVWIPIIAVALGTVADKVAQLRGATRDAVSAEAIKAKYAQQPA